MYYRKPIFIFTWKIKLMFFFLERVEKMNIAISPDGPWALHHYFYYHAVLAGHCCKIYLNDSLYLTLILTTTRHKIAYPTTSLTLSHTLDTPRLHSSFHLLILKEIKLKFVWKVSRTTKKVRALCQGVDRPR